MGTERLLVGLVVFGIFGCLCNAQRSYQYLNITRGSGTAQQYGQRPVASQAPITARPTFGRNQYTQAPVTARPTTGKPVFTQALVTARPSTRRPVFTQAPVTARPSTRRPVFTQAPVTARPSLGKPSFTQAPVTHLPTLGGPKLPTTPVEAPTPKPDAVKVHCGESSVQIEVDMDLLGIGHLIQSSDISLGGCVPVAQDESSQMLQFETALHDCGSVLEMTGDYLVYIFTLNYEPKAIGATPIIRTSGAVVGIKCQYPRLHNVSSNALKPTWIPYYSTLSAEDILVFSLKLMADNWRLERTSNVFFLGDLINIEASVLQFNHVPLRVFVDYCVATLDPKMNAVPRYAFIENKGCLVDSKLTSSRSQFLPRVQDDKLQFQLDAFRFAQEARSAIYIFCHLRATAVLAESDGKACSFDLGRDRWIGASGNDAACACCDTSCPGRKGRSADSAVQYEGAASLGPIVVQEADADASAYPSPMKAEGATDAVVIAGVVAAAGLVCMIVLGTALLWRQ